MDSFLKHALITKDYCVDKFNEHPHEAGESYCEHFVYASTTGLKLVGYGVIGIVHGVFPFLFEETVSTNGPK